MPYFRGNGGDCVRAASLGYNADAGWGNWQDFEGYSMGLVERVQRWIRGKEPTLVDYEAYGQSSGQMGGQYGGTSPEGPMGVPAGETPPGVLGKVGPSAPPPPAPGAYKIQQSYDALLTTVQELRAALDGQSRRQEEFFERLGTLPQAAEALPQTSKMQSDMLKLINDRLAMHAAQQRKVSDVISGLGSGAASAGPAKKEYAEALQSIREQIEMGNEIDRQLVESFNRFSMMIDGLQIANQHAVDALQQVRDSYAASAMQMHEWIEKSRHRGGWLVGLSFLMAAGSLVIALLMMMRVAGH